MSTDKPEPRIELHPLDHHIAIVRSADRTRARFDITTHPHVAPVRFKSFDVRADVLLRFVVQLDIPTDDLAKVLLDHLDGKRLLDLVVALAEPVHQAHLAQALIDSLAESNEEDC